MILSAQSIRRLCMETRGCRYVRDEIEGRRWYSVVSPGPLITPFSERGLAGGRSYGLASCSYDCRAAQSALLKPGENVLVSTMEMFNMPPDVCGSVLDKSSWARLGLSAFNTHLDPGWRQLEHPDSGILLPNHLTVELFNASKKPIEIVTGDPICQVKFEWLDAPTELPYSETGKYQSQPNKPIPAILERALP